MARYGLDGRRDAQRLITLALGAVASGAGAHSALTGDGSLPGRGGEHSRVDSELRYYGVFYAAYGLVALRTGLRAEPDPDATRGLAAVLFAGGVARANGWRARGRPHPVQVALLAAELGVPPLLLGLARER